MRSSADDYAKAAEVGLEAFKRQIIEAQSAEPLVLLPSLIYALLAQAAATEQVAELLASMEAHGVRTWPQR